MKAIAVLPGKPDSVHLADLTKPAVTDVPDGRGVLVKVLRVGVDGTDKEINAAEYGAAPPGYDFLVIGHEGFGQVEAVGSQVTEVQPGDYVVATVRRPGTSLYDLIGTNDMTTDDTYFERGINLRHGFLTEHYVDDAEFIVKVPRGLREVGVAMGLAGQPECRDLHAPKAEDECREEPDRPGAHHRGSPRAPHPQAPLDLVRLGDALLDDGHRLEEDADLAQAPWHLHDELGIVDVVLGEEAVSQVDPALDVGVVRAHVVGADQVVEAPPGAADGGDDMVARLHLRHL